LDSTDLAGKITDLIFSKKGYDVKILDLRKLTTIADYFIICSADSDTQVKAIADEVDKKLRDEGIKSWHTEGYRSLSWVLIDFVDVVVHVFKKQARDFYNLEKLWGDAPAIEVTDPMLKAPLKKKPGRPKKAKTGSTDV
jgi:ribosome-associated protein